MSLSEPLQGPSERETTTELSLIVYPSWGSYFGTLTNVN